MKQSVNWLIVIAASAGGIDALTQVLSGLTKDLPVTMLIVQHMKEDYPTHLHEHLERCAALPVRLAKNGLNLEAGVTYLAVPGQHLRLKDSTLALDCGPSVNYVRPSADVLFSSAAEAFGSHVIGIVLSGTGRDGTKGCQEIKAKGGIIIAQKDALYPDMPQSAIEMGLIDYVLPVSEIPGKIALLVWQGNQNNGGYSGRQK